MDVLDGLFVTANECQSLTIRQARWLFRVFERHQIGTVRLANCGAWSPDVSDCSVVTVTRRLITIQLHRNLRTTQFGIGDRQQAAVSTHDLLNDRQS